MVSLDYPLITIIFGMLLLCVDEIASLIMFDNCDNSRLSACQLIFCVNNVCTYVQHMEEQEKEHVECFEDLIVERRVRPSLLLPLWELAGYALGEYVDADCMCTHDLFYWFTSCL